MAVTFLQRNVQKSIVTLHKLNLHNKRAQRGFYRTVKSLRVIYVSGFVS